MLTAALRGSASPLLTLSVTADCPIVVCLPTHLCQHSLLLGTHCQQRALCRIDTVSVTAVPADCPIVVCLPTHLCQHSLRIGSNALCVASSIFLSIFSILSIACRLPEYCLEITWICKWICQESARRKQCGRVGGCLKAKRL